MGRPLSEHQRDALARMVVSGLPKATIARALGSTPVTVDRYIKDDQDIQARIQDQEARVLRALATHHVEMLDMLDDARAAIRDGLHSQDQRLKVETARWIHERVVPREQTSEVNVNVQGAIEHEVNGTLKAILGHMVEIRGSAPATAGYLDRVRSGPNALPGVTVVPPQTTDTRDSAPEDDSGPEPSDPPEQLLLPLDS